MWVSFLYISYKIVEKHIKLFELPPPRLRLEVEDS